MLINIWDLFDIEAHLSAQDAVLRIIISLLAGFIIVLERGRHRQMFSMRAHILISVGSTLIMLLSIYVPQMYGMGMSFDPGRIAAQVVVGIGFLGAAAIIRMGVNVKGLTTASTVWVSAAIGLAIGAGFYIPALLTSAIVLLVLIFVDALEKKLFSEQLFKRIYISYKGTKDASPQLREILKQRGMSPTSLDIHYSIVENKSDIVCALFVPNKIRGVELVNSIREELEVEILEAGIKMDV